jgi:signal transduction histidine kinase
MVVRFFFDSEIWVMKDENKTKAQLIEELTELRRQVAQQRAPEGESGRFQHGEIVWRVQHRLRDAVAKMQSSDDIQHILSVLEEGLHELKIPFQDCGINLVDLQSGSTTVGINSLGREGEWQSLGKERAADTIVQFWKAGVPAYRPDLATEDILNERQICLEYFGHPVRSIVDVPFAYGMLRVNSGEPDAFTKGNIADLLRLSLVIEEGFRRMEDIQKLEQHNRKLTAEISERKQTEEALQERTRIQEAFRHVTQATLSSLDFNEVLDTLGTEVVEVGIFRSLSISVPDYPKGVVRQIRSIIRNSEGEIDIYTGEIERALDSKDILAETVRTGEMQIALEEDDRLTGPRVNYKGQIAYFIPLKEKERVVAVLATGGTIEEKEQTLYKFDAIQPLLDQVVIAFKNASLFTEHKQMEQELIHTQRLRALNEMAAGVSHNLNNMLVSVLGPALLLQRATKDPQVLREVEEIITGAKRTRDLIQRLNQAVRGEQEGELYPVSVNEMVQQVVHSTQPRWKDQSEALGITIEVATELEDVPSIPGNASELSDILLNLLFNAVDAMPEGGTITFRTRAVEESIQLTVRDTGKGMEEETRRKVFEPFFTTKMDIGTGLGLTTVHGTMTRWDGDIDVESTPDEGTTFTLRFPIWTEPEAEREEKTAEEYQVRSGKLLIVEDDEGTCGLLDRLLSETHEVKTVLDGREALEQFAPDQYDVVLIDLGMPGLPGDRIAREIKQADPLVITVLITGWDLKPDDPRKDIFDFRIEKPFDDLDEVENIVARAIELHDQRAKEGN